MCVFDTDSTVERKIMCKSKKTIPCSIDIFIATPKVSCANLVLVEWAKREAV